MLLFCLIIISASIVIIIIPAISNKTINIDDMVIVSPKVKLWHTVHVVFTVTIGVDPIDEGYHIIITYYNNNIKIYNVSLMYHKVFEQ